MSFAMLSRKSETAPPSKAKPAFDGLRVGEANDASEREADRIADEVMAIGTPRLGWSISRMSVIAPVQREADDAIVGRDAPPIVHEVLSSPGRPLDQETRSFFEPRFGHDFSNVRVHADGLAAASAQAMNALAYTIGPHVVFSRGRYVPSTIGGDKLVAHELAHVVQQTSGTPGAVSALELTPPSGRAEQKATLAATSVTQGRSITPMSPRPVELARQAAAGNEPQPHSDLQSVYARERRRAAKASDAQIKEEVAKTDRQLQSVTEAKKRMETLGTVALVAAGVLIGALAGGIVGGGPAGAVIGGIVGGVVVGTLGRVLLIQKLDEIKGVLSDKLRAWEEEQLLRERTGSTTTIPTVNVEDLPKAQPPTVNVEDLPKAK